MANHISVSGSIDIDLNTEISMQTIFDSIQLSYPKDPTLSVVSIDIPLLNLACKEFGIINPISDIKAAASRMYDHSMKIIFKKIWDVIYGLYNKLMKFGLAVLDLKLPILDLTVSDLFAPDLYDRVKLAVTKLWNTAKDKLDKILELLKIPNPLFKEIQSPEKQIEAIVNQIYNSLWGELFKLIDKVYKLIKKALAIYDAITRTKPFSAAVLWDKFVEATWGKLIDLLTHPPSIQQIHDWIVAYATKIWKKIPTYDEIMQIIHNFKIPILNIKPFDWDLPLNVKVKAPNLDFVQLLNDIKIWINNYIMKIIQKFIAKIVKILQLFAVPLMPKLPIIHIPIKLCAIRVES